MDVRRFDIRTKPNDGVKKLDEGWEKLNEDELVAKLIGLEEESVKEKGDDKVKQEDKGRKIQIPNGLAFDGSGDWSVFETTLEGHRAFYNLSGQEMKYILSLIIKAKRECFCID